MDGISVVSGIWFTILEENGFTICQQHRLGRVQESKSTGVISRQDQDPPMKKTGSMVRMSFCGEYYELE
jgi:hypothetical protein